MTRTLTDQDRRFEEAAVYAPALTRLARGYEADADRQRDLVQDIQLALWRSFALYDGRCSLRTWVFRIAHNTAVSHIQKEKRARTAKWIGLDHIENLGDGGDAESELHARQLRERLLGLVQRLEPTDRQIILLYLEGLDAAAIGEITGFAAAQINSKVQRLKALLSRNFHQDSVKGAAK